MDLDLSVTVSRDLLSLGDLELNDFVNYSVAATGFMGANRTWSRTQVTSPFVDGSSTTQRQRVTVNEPITVEVYGGNAAELQANMAALQEALDQDNFVLTITVEGTVYAYQGESADCQVVWTGPRMIEHQGQMVFSMPRQPNALVGAVG